MSLKKMEKHILLDDSILDKHNPPEQRQNNARQMVTSVQEMLHRNPYDILIMKRIPITFCL